MPKSNNFSILKSQYWCRYWLVAYSATSHYLNAELWSIGLLWTNFSENLQNFSFIKMHLNISPAKWRPSWGRLVLMWYKQITPFVVFGGGCCMFISLYVNVRESYSIHCRHTQASGLNTPPLWVSQWARCLPWLLAAARGSSCTRYLDSGSVVNSWTLSRVIHWYKNWLSDS